MQGRRKEVGEGKGRGAKGEVRGEVRGREQHRIYMHKETVHHTYVF